MIYTYITYIYVDKLLLDHFVKTRKGMWLGGSSPDFQHCDHEKHEKALAVHTLKLEILDHS